jgi:iron complex outermembrane receptor protein
MAAAAGSPEWVDVMTFYGTHRWRQSLAFLMAALPFSAVCQEFAQVRGLADMTLEELSQIRVTSVSHRPEPLAEAPASIYVITARDIRRSGATSLPEALRLAPNLLVARVNANDYAVTSSRGFFSTLGTKLLIMIDGRSIYTPLFAGVTWDAHDVMLEDIDRIEVISGPGGTTWGTNAVIGVINIITKSAAETQGVLASAYAGNKEDGIAARYGGTLGAGHFRAYAKRFVRDNLSRADGTPLRESGWRNQGGFRADWQDARDAVSVQGNVYEAEREEGTGRRDLSGVNLLGRWERTLANGASAMVKAYFDRAERDQARAFYETLDIVDLEARYTMAATGAHRFAWGGGYRHADDRTGSDVAPVFVPQDRSLNWWNVFVQDEIALRPNLRLTLGVRAEHNTYTGLEFLPSARLAWQAAPGRLVWSALSRAVRSPSRIDREFAVPSASPPFRVPGGPQFVSEVSNVWEVGYRSQPTPNISYSLTAFVHDHDDLRSGEQHPSGFRIENRLEGRTRGIEGWSTWQAMRAWRLSGGFVFLDQDIVREPGSTANVFGEGNDPTHRVMLRSSHDLGDRMDLDIILQRMGELPSPRVPSYTSLDVRLGWNVSHQVTLELVGQNLLDRAHPEFGAAAVRAEIPRSVFVRARLRY